METDTAYRKKSQLLSVWRRFRRNKLAMLGLIVFLVIALCAVFADFLADYQQLAIT